MNWKFARCWNSARLLMTRAALTDGLKGHLFRRAPGASFPVEEQSGIGLSDVVTRPDPDTACSLINPARRALDLAKVPDGRFIHHDVALSVSPLPTEFLIAKRRRVTQGA